MNAVLPVAAAPLDVAPFGRSEPVGLESFAEGRVAKRHWAVRGVWPLGAMGVIGGRPKDGKSSLAAELAVSLWSGTPMFALDTFPVDATPAGVLYVQQENADSRVQYDLQQILVARDLGMFVDEDGLGTRAGPGEAPAAAFEYNDHGRSCFAEEPFRVLSHAGLDLSSPDDQAWIEERLLAREYQYLVLDPLYNLIGATKIGDGGDELRSVLKWLTAVKNTLGVAPVVTHHMSNKGGDHGASALLGSTYLHAWYEAALFTQRSDDGAFVVSADALRDMGEVREHTLQGLGVGHWYYAPSAQGIRDVTGRRAPGSAAKETRAARLAELEVEHPEWTNAELGDALGIKVRAVQKLKAEARALAQAVAEQEAEGRDV